MPPLAGCPLSVSCFSPLSRTPARSHGPMSRRIRGSAILCATIRHSHSWSTESKKLRMSALSTRFTRWLMIAVCSASSAMCRLHLAESHRRTRKSRLRRRHSAPRRLRLGQSCPPAPAPRVAASGHRLWEYRPAAPAAAGSDRCGPVRRDHGGLTLQSLFVLRHCHPIDPSPAASITLRRMRGRSCARMT